MAIPVLSRFCSHRAVVAAPPRADQVVRCHEFRHWGAPRVVASTVQQPSAAEEPKTDSVCPSSDAFYLNDLPLVGYLSIPRGRSGVAVGEAGFESISYLVRPARGAARGPSTPTVFPVLLDAVVCEVPPALLACACPGGPLSPGPPSVVRGTDGAATAAAAATTRRPCQGVVAMDGPAPPSPALHPHRATANAGRRTSVVCAVGPPTAPPSGRPHRRPRAAARRARARGPSRERAPQRSCGWHPQHGRMDQMPPPLWRVQQFLVSPLAYCLRFHNISS